MDCTKKDSEIEIFCNPICYLKKRKGKIQPKWVSFQKWYISKKQEDRLEKEFILFKRILNIKPEVTIEDALSGRIEYIPIDSDEDESSEIESEED